MSISSRPNIDLLFWLLQEKKSAEAEHLFTDQVFVTLVKFRGSLACKSWPRASVHYYSVILLRFGDCGGMGREEICRGRKQRRSSINYNSR